MSVQVVEKFNGILPFIAGAQEAMKEAMLQVAEAIYDDAYDATPVDTGEMQRSLFIAQEQDGTVIIGYGAEHAVFVELGTRYMAARPTLGPAFDRHIGDFDKIVTQLVRGILPR